MSYSTLGISKSPSIKERVITQAIAVIFFVILPIIITLVVPLTKIELKNSDSGATVTVVRHMLIFIPWKTEKISNVTKIRVDVTAEKHYQDTSENRRKGQTGVRVATGQLALINGGPEVIIQAAPELAKNTVIQFDEFVASKSKESLNLTIYASWSLTYILGGVATSLCALYVFGATISVILFPFKLLRSKLAKSVKSKL